MSTAGYTESLCRLRLLDTIERSRTDREEISKLAFYSKVKSKEKIAAIDEKLLEFWK